MNSTLHIHSASGTVTSGTGDKIVFDRRYPLPDSDGHYVVVSRFGQELLQICIKHEGQKKPVQRGFVPRLSATCGNTPYAGPRINDYTIHLHPEMPIFPISNLVRQLRDMGVDRYHISPMFSPTLDDCVRNAPTTKMWSDGEVYVDYLPFESMRHEEYLPRVSFTVKTATWAILQSGDPDKPFIHIYLWMEAATNAAEIIQAVRLVQEGREIPGANSASGT